MTKAEIKKQVSLIIEDKGNIAETYLAMLITEELMKTKTELKHVKRCHLDEILSVAFEMAEAMKLGKPALLAQIVKSAYLTALVNITAAAAKNAAEWEPLAKDLFYASNATCDEESEDRD